MVVAFLDVSPEASEPEAEAGCENDFQDPAVEVTGTQQSPDEDARRLCSSCGRRFVPSSLERHQRVCQQVFRTSRPQFDAMKGSSIVSKEAMPRTLGVPISRSGNCASPAARVNAEPRTPVFKPGRRTPPPTPVDGTPAEAPRTSGAVAARDKSPIGSNIESIEEQEQRVMQMLRSQMEELRDMRRRCSQSNMPLFGEEELAVPKPSRRGTSSVEVVVASVDGSRTAANQPTLVVGSSAASGSRVPRRKSCENENDPTSGLKMCEDCGRRFNPASFEKHRSVCRSVFGKPNRTPFESHAQRLRSLPVGWDASPPRERTPGTEAAVVTTLPCVKEASGQVSNPCLGEANGSPTAMPKSIAARKACSRMSPKSNATEASWRHPAGEVLSRELPTQEPPCGQNSSPGPNGAARLTSPSRPLQPCPFCGRSFRAAAFDKHTKVCQSVFPSHDGRSEQRYVYDSRRHRLKGTAFQAYTSTSPTPSQTDRAASSTPPMPPRGNASALAPPVVSQQVRGSSRSPKTQLRRSASESQIPTSQFPRSPSPPAASPTELQGSLQSPAPRRRNFNLSTEEEPIAEARRHESSDELQRQESLGCTPSIVYSPDKVINDIAARVAEGLEAARLRAASPEETRPSNSPRNSQDLRSFLEDRRGRLERARFGMKINQRPEYTSLLKASSSEQALRLVGEYGPSVMLESSAVNEAVHTTLKETNAAGVSPGRLERLEKALHGAARASDWISQSQPVLCVPGSEGRLRSIAGPPPPTAQTLQVASEKRGRSPGSDLRSYYERCLEHLDSIDASQTTASAPVSTPSLLKAKAGFTREDLAAGGESRGIQEAQARAGFTREDPAAGGESREIQEAQARAGFTREDLAAGGESREIQEAQAKAALENEHPIAETARDEVRAVEAKPGTGCENIVVDQSPVEEPTLSDHGSEHSSAKLSGNGVAALVPSVTEACPPEISVETTQSLGNVVHQACTPEAFAETTQPLGNVVHQACTPETFGETTQPLGNVVYQAVAKSSSDICHPHGILRCSGVSRSRPATPLSGSLQARLGSRSTTPHPLTPRRTSCASQSDSNRSCSAIVAATPRVCGMMTHAPPKLSGSQEALCRAVVRENFPASVQLNAQVPSVTSAPSVPVWAPPARMSPSVPIQAVATTLKGQEGVVAMPEAAATPPVSVSSTLSGVLYMTQAASASPLNSITPPQGQCFPRLDMHKVWGHPNDDPPGLQGAGAILGAAARQDLALRSASSFPSAACTQVARARHKAT